MHEAVNSKMAAIIFNTVVEILSIHRCDNMTFTLLHYISDIC